jgi:hypothetical protein
MNRLTSSPNRSRHGFALALFALLLFGPAGEVHARDKVGLVLAQPGNSPLADQAIDAASTAFLDCKAFTVIERTSIDDVMQEKSFKGFIGEAEGAEMGELLGLRWIGIVQYADERNRLTDGTVQQAWELSVRMIDVASGRVTMTLSSRPGEADLGDRTQGTLKGFLRRSLVPQELQGIAASYEPTMAGAGRRLLARLRLEFPPEGYVIELLGGDEVSIDLGVDDGVEDGDMLEVFTVAEPKLHPVTGEQLPGRETVVGKLKVVDVRRGMSTCKIKDGGAAIAVGSRIRFQSQKGPLGRLSTR